MQLYTNTTNEANAAFRLIYAVKYGSYRGCQRVNAVKSVFLNDFGQARTKLYLTYYERAVGRAIQYRIQTRFCGNKAANYSLNSLAIQQSMSALVCLKLSRFFARKNATHGKDCI